MSANNHSIGLWAITTTDASGVPHVMITTDLDQAIAAFMKQVYLFVHADPKEHFKIVGNERDAALSELYLMMLGEDEQLCLCSMNQASGIESLTGWTPKPYGNQGFAALATGLQAALDLAHGKLAPEEVDRLGFSHPAMMMHRRLAAELLVEDLEREHQEMVSPELAKSFWEDMANVKQMMTMSVKL